MSKFLLVLCVIAVSIFAGVAAAQQWQPGQSQKQDVQSQDTRQSSLRPQEVQTQEQQQPMYPVPGRSQYQPGVQQPAPPPGGIHLKDGEKQQIVKRERVSRGDWHGAAGPGWRERLQQKYGGIGEWQQSAKSEQPKSAKGQWHLRKRDQKRVASEQKQQKETRQSGRQGQSQSVPMGRR